MAKTSISAPKPADLPRFLLDWYDLHGRALPWRIDQGRAPSPYHTWMSEIMLQQTTVVTVIPYYQRFLAKWPSVEDLASAHEDDVLKEWAGLGYYSRARNLLKCAREIVEKYAGIFPQDIDQLKSLPGIGDYTANAIRAIAHDLPANVVDGNVERVMARLFSFEKPINLPENKKHIKTLAGNLASQERPGDYAQALMDLGATICTPKNPKCTECPLNKNCAAFALGKTHSIPVIQRNKKNPERSTHCLVMRDNQNRFFLQQRPAQGLLGGLWEFPSSPWIDRSEKKPAPKFDMPEALKDVITLEKPVIHVFTHFKLTVTVHVSLSAVPQQAIIAPGTWFPLDDLPALSTLTRKILEAALKTMAQRAEL